MKEKKLFLVCPSVKGAEKANFMIDAAACPQGAIEMFWFQFWGAVMPSIFLYSQCVSHSYF